jgi:hypothetical protein
MHRQDNPIRSVTWVERKYRRFNIRYPVRVGFHTSEVASEVDAITRNVSTGGLLLETALPIPQCSSVLFVITLKGIQSARSIELFGEGEVVRVEPAGPGSKFVIAIECTSPITQLETLLSFSA